MTDTDEATQEVRILSEADPPAVKKRRLYHLDNLRAVAVLAVLVMHTSICYMFAAPPLYYVVDPDGSLFFTVIVMVLDVPIMSAMFLVAGYFALPSLRRRGLGGFVREKLTRLGVPWVFGVVVLAPALTYLSYLSRGTQIPYLQFWVTDFWGPLYQQGIYWFLGVLLALFLLLAVALKVKPGLLQRPAVGSAVPWRAVLAVFAVAVVAAAALSPFYGVGDWQSLGWVFMVQPARVALYPAFFVLGIHAERQGWLAGDGWRPSVKVWIPLAAISGLVYLAFTVAVYSTAMAAYSTTIPVRVISGVLFMAFDVSGVLAAVAGFSRWGDQSTRTWRALSDNAFGIYYVHPLVLYPGAWLLVSLTIPGPLKAVVVLAVTVALSLAISEGILGRAPILRRMF